jgi:sporulation protein YlmC with PRC-barrel domain
MHDPQKWGLSNQGGKVWDVHLRSTQHVSGYHIQATDGEIGHVEDFIIDDESWAIRYLVIDTHNWLPGKKVLVSPKWIESVSWSQSKIFVNLTREKIKQSPAFTDKSLLTRDYEAKLYQHYNCPEYWVEDQIPKGRIFNKNIKETAQL